MFIQHFISALLEQSIQSITPITGGSINEAYKIVTADNQHFFCKINSSNRFPAMFEKERRGLLALAATGTIKTPSCIAVKESAERQLMVLEWVDMGIRSNSFWKKFGEQLAALHHCTFPDFGFYEDNYMGALPQVNSFHPEWDEFFVQQRLKPQVKMAVDKGMLNPVQSLQFEKLYKIIPFLFDTEKPVLVHGDLWSGNFLCGKDELPVLIDPAVYYGHRQVDMAMTTLFGGFEPAFYHAYHYHYPLPADHREQWKICNLYPLLVHLNLFGKSYLPEIMGTIDAY